MLAGAFVFFFLKPKLFADHPFSQRAFGFWLVQWFVLIVLWAAYAGYPSRAVLAAIDLYVVATLGFFWTYAEAESFQWPRTLRNLVGIYGALLLWNLLIGTMALKNSSSHRWRWIWVMPSESVSVISLFLVALVFLYRYGPPAIPLACVLIPVYAFLQRPTYFSLFIAPKSNWGDGWLLALAAGKLCYGLLFYTLFFLPARRYGPVQHPHFDATLPQFRRIGRWALVSAGGLILSVGATLLAEWIGGGLKLK